MHIKQSTKKSLIDNFSKRLLGLEFKANHSKIARNVLPTIQGINYLQTLFLFFRFFFNKLYSVLYSLVFHLHSLNSLLFSRIYFSLSKS